MLADHPVIPLYFYVSKHLVSPKSRAGETMFWIIITLST